MIEPNLIEQSLIEQIANSAICWAILLLALVCYQQLWCQYLSQFEHSSSPSKSPASMQRNVAFTGILIGALPLLGLLGTIAGLLECFAGIANNGASSELVSDGIGKALLTTQLGLLCAIPGWLLHAWVKSKMKHQHSFEHNSECSSVNPSYVETH